MNVKQTILELCNKWQQQSMWNRVQHSATQFMTASLTESEAIEHATIIQHAHGELAVLQTLVRNTYPSLLALVCPKDFLRDFRKDDSAERIRDLCELAKRICDEWH